MRCQKLLFGSHIIHHDFIYLQLLIDSPDHHLFIYGLIRAADIIPVKIHIHIIHFLHVRQRLKHEKIVHIKSMLRQLQPAVLQKLCTENDGMHKDVLSFMEPVHIIPCKNLVLREHMAVTDYLFALFPFFFIYIVGDQHIQDFLAACKLRKLIKDFPVSRIRNPVIAVHHLEIQPRCILDACIYR